MKNPTLLKKILIMIGVPVVIAFIITMTITQYLVKNAIVELRTSDLSNSSAYTSEMIGQVFAKYMEIANQMAANDQIEELLLDTQPGQRVDSKAIFPQINKTMVNVAETDGSILYSWIADTDSSQYYQSNDEFSPDDFQIAQRPWYIELMEKKRAFVSEPYQDFTSKDTIVSAVAPVFREGTDELIGAACVDVSVKDITEMLAQQKLGNTGFYMLTTAAGQVFYHPNADYINKNVSEINSSDDVKEAIKNKKTGDIEYTFEREKVHGYVSTLGETGWILTSALPDKEFNKTFVTVSTILLIVLGIALTIVIILIVVISRRIANPLKRVAYVVGEMSKGHFSERLEVNGKDEVGMMSEAINSFVDELQTNVVGVMKKISMGDVSVEVSSRDEHDEINPAMRDMVETIRKMDQEVQTLIQAVTAGKLDQRGDETAYSGSWKDLISGINGLIEAFIKPFNVSSEYIDRISKGDIPPKITESYFGDFNQMKDNLNICIDAVNGLIDDANMLSQSAVEGRLNVRADVSKHGGDFAKIIDGVNNSIDALTQPINTMAGYLDRIGKGEIPEKIREEYRGDFGKIKDSINDCVDGLAGLSEGIEILGLMAKNNDYSRGVEGSYSGVYANMAESINQVNDTFKRLIRVLLNIAAGDLQDLEWLKPIGKRSENDELMPAIIMMSENIQSLIDEASVLTEAALLGKLETRVNSDKFQGTWKDLIDQMNNILEGAANPLNEVTAVLNELSKGNLQVSVEGSYHGQFDVLKQAINFTTKHLRDIIQEITRVLAQIADKHLAVESIESFDGDYAEISDSLNIILQSLNQVMGDIYEAAEQVSMGARQVSQGSQTLSQGSTEQASAIEELTSSIADIASQTKQNAVNANSANDLAETAKIHAQNGDSQMREMLKAMKEINDSSANISNIIKVIDDIAFQTNILALNAAVEAARAGQHGKGFAVVAEEVRTLAARSAAAAKETTSLIEGSINKVQAGTKIANETAEALRDIVEGVDQAAGLVHGIAEASNEQASGITQVNQGIEQVSLVVQNNSATAEESAASSEELSSQAELLKNMVGEFTLLSSEKVKMLDAAPLLDAGTQEKKQSHPKILLSKEEFDKY